jgi:uncharacterized membrane protein (UPF0127 family)
MANIYKYLLGIGLVLVLVSLIFYIPHERGPSVTVGDVRYSVLLADTLALQIKGLSGHPGLDENEGMLFVFEDSIERSFWMKDMNFSIDIIWIDENFKVVGFVERATPESYPQSFSSLVPVQYVLEVNAGDVAKKGIEVGDIVTLK